MTFVAALNQELDQKFLLKHEFYQAWTAGQLNQDYLATYAQQYFHHVDAFPRYISATHANCDSLTARQVLLENLVEEEQGERNHPELWLRFAEGIGADRQTVKNAKLFPETQALIDTFLACAKSSYAEGVGALYAYERQIPAVAESKIAGLKKHYNIDAPATLDFFTVHLEADVFHSHATQQLLEDLSPADQAKAQIGANKVADALWNFLSGVQRETMGECGC